MANIQRHDNKVTDQTCVGNSTTVVTGSYNIGQNRLCKVRVELYILSGASIDFGVYEILFVRGTNGASITRSVAIVPLVFPGVTAGASVGVSLVNGPAGNGNTIQTTFTNPASGNRTIRVISDFLLKTIQD
jgi:hypothetical protein